MKGHRVVQSRGTNLSTPRPIIRVGFTKQRSGIYHRLLENKSRRSGFPLRGGKERRRRFIAWLSVDRCLAEPRTAAVL